MSQTRFFNIQIDDFTNFKGLIVADFHLGSNNLFDIEEKLLIKNLNLLVEKEKPTHIFILGDIIHYSLARSDEWYFDFFKMLENNFSLPIYIIPGNHDYDLFPEIRNCFSLYNNKNNVKCIDTEFLEIKYSDDFSLFLGHDAAQNNFVHFKEPVVRWMNDIRHYYSKNKIKDTDVLIFGHTHEDIDDDETKNYTIAPFSISLEESSYGIISFSQGFSFEHKSNFPLNIENE